MAKIQYGPIASDIRGSSGGTVFSRNKGGAYMRARVVGVNPNSPKQAAVRSQFSNNSKQWSGALSSSQRAAWTFFAQANPVINVLGASIILSGLAMFNRLNQVLAQVGVAAVLDPPADLSVPALAATSGLNVNVAGSTIAISTAAQAVVAGAAYYVFATGPLAPGRTPAANQFRNVGYYPAVAAAVQVDFSASWASVFGSLIAGKTYGAKIATVNLASGAVTPFLTYVETV